MAQCNFLTLKLWISVFFDGKCTVIARCFNSHVTTQTLWHYMLHLSIHTAYPKGTSTCSQVGGKESNPQLSSWQETALSPELTDDTAVPGRWHGDIYSGALVVPGLRNRHVKTFPSGMLCDFVAEGHFTYHITHKQADIITAVVLNMHHVWSSKVTEEDIFRGRDERKERTEQEIRQATTPDWLLLVAQSPEYRQDARWRPNLPPSGGLMRKCGKDLVPL